MGHSLYPRVAPHAARAHSRWGEALWLSGQLSQPARHCPHWGKQQAWKGLRGRSRVTQHQWSPLHLHMNPGSTKNVARPSPNASVSSCVTTPGRKPSEGREGRRATGSHTAEKPEEHMVLGSIWLQLSPHQALEGSCLGW